MGRFGGVATVLVAVMGPSVANAADEPKIRESEYEMGAAEAWAQEGFRIQLRFGTESLKPLEKSGVPGGAWAIGVEPGVRLSRFWSLSANLRYSVLTDSLEGLRWSTTADLGFHPYGGSFIAAGIGYGGLLANHWDDSGYRECDGHAVVALAKVGWLFAVGELFATGPVVQFDAQSTSCGNSVDDSFDEEGFASPSARPRSTWWSHRTLNLSWSVAWR